MVGSSDTTRFVYANQQCLEEYDGSGNLLRLFAFGSGLDEVVLMEAPDVADVDSDGNTTEKKRFYYHTQLIGSVTQVTDEDEVVVESYDYGPYGEISIFDQSASSVSVSQIGNPFTYTRRRLDEETGLYYYRARHYSAELKRFIQRDPMEYVNGASPYAYASQSPLGTTDGTGLQDRRAHIDYHSGSPAKGEDGSYFGKRPHDGGGTEYVLRNAEGKTWSALTLLDTLTFKTRQLQQISEGIEFAPGPWRNAHGVSTADGGCAVVRPRKARAVVLIDWLRKFPTVILYASVPAWENPHPDFPRDQARDLHDESVERTLRHEHMHDDKVQSTWARIRRRLKRKFYGPWRAEWTESDSERKARADLPDLREQAKVEVDRAADLVSKAMARSTARLPRNRKLYPYPFILQTASGVWDVREGLAKHK